MQKALCQMNSIHETVDEQYAYPISTETLSCTVKGNKLYSFTL